MVKKTMLIGDVTFTQFDPFDGDWISASPGVVLIEDKVAGGYALSRSSCLKTRVGRIKAGALGGVLEQRYQSDWYGKVRCWFAICSRLGRGYITPKSMATKVEVLLGDSLLTRQLLVDRVTDSKVTRYTHRESGLYFITHPNPSLEELLLRLKEHDTEPTSDIGKFMIAYGEGLKCEHFIRSTRQVNRADGNVSVTVRDIVARYGISKCLSHCEVMGQLVKLI